MKSNQIFGCVNNISYDAQVHPIEELMKECGIKSYPITTENNSATGLCVIVSHGAYPTKNLLVNQIDHLKRMMRERGYEVQLNGSYDAAGIVVGVESIGLFEAAAKGIKTILIPTGLGIRLYSNMFPNGEIMHLNA
jgi:hypothetical protein